VITGSLLPATSPVMRAVGRLPVSGKVLHFGAYTWLALLAIKRRSLAVVAALAVILLGVALEFGQKLMPGMEESSKSATCSLTEPGSLPVSQSVSLAAVSSQCSFTA